MAVWSWGASRKLSLQRGLGESRGVGREVGSHPNTDFYRSIEEGGAQELHRGEQAGVELAGLQEGRRLSAPGLQAAACTRADASHFCC